jgi:Protein of unknown function (DUF2838)
LNRNRHNPSAQFPSGGIQSLLEEADSDVLLLYDCCHSAIVPNCRSQQGGVTEAIAACGYETTAPEVDEHSFTKALVEILIIASKEVPFSVGQLHSRILSNLKCCPPRVKALPNRDILYERQPRRTPVYSLLSETNPRRSIVLGPLLSPPSQRPTYGQEKHSPLSSNSTLSTLGMNGAGNPRKRKKECSQDIKSAQILIAIRVDETPSNVEEWVNWMRNTPRNGRDIHVEGRWDSFSTLFLVRMPVEVWNLLPEHPAYSFVGFVTSENHVLSQAPINSNAPCYKYSWSEPILEPDTSKLHGQEQPEVLAGGPSAGPLNPEPGEPSASPNQLNISGLKKKAVLDKIDQIVKCWNSAESITLRERILFICGVFNILLSGYIIGGWPQYFHYWYTGQLLYLLPIRYYTFHKRGFHFFLADLCYIVNILCMCTIWLFPRSTRLFIGTYCLAFGNNAISITMWRSIMVFHSLDEVTTVFIHVMPCVALHCMVHLLPPDLLQQRFPAIWAIKILSPSLRVQDSLLAMTIWSTVPYLIWQLSYYFMITVRQQEHIAAGKPTSFTWLRRRYAQTVIGKLLLSLPESLQEPFFMMLQYIYIVLTSLPCLIWFWNRYASAAFLMAVFSGSVYNGATYYVDVFDKRHKNEEESREQRNRRK